jgi:hypothetical protein
MRALRWRADLKAAASRTRQVGEELQPGTSLPDEKILKQEKFRERAKRVTSHIPLSGRHIISFTVVAALCCPLGVLGLPRSN